jgi:hypothetical protein
VRDRGPSGFGPDRVQYSSVGEGRLRAVATQFEFKCGADGLNKEVGLISQRPK